MDDSVRPPPGAIRVELHDSLHHFGVLLLRLERAGCEIVRYRPGANVAMVSGPDAAVDRVAVEWDLEGWIELGGKRLDDI